MRNKSEAKVVEMEAARVAAAKRVTDAERATSGAAARRQAYARLMRRFEERRALRNELEFGISLAREALDTLKRIASEFPWPHAGKHPTGYRLRLLDEEIAIDAEEAGLPVPFLDVFPTVEFSGELRSLARSLSARIEPGVWPLPLTQRGKEKLVAERESLERADAKALDSGG